MSPGKSPHGLRHSSTFGANSDVMSKSVAERRISVTGDRRLMMKQTHTVELPPTKSPLLSMKK